LQHRSTGDVSAAVRRGPPPGIIVQGGFRRKMGHLLFLKKPRLEDLIATRKHQTRRYARTPCAGRTYGQHAAPVTFGFKAGVWLAGIASAASDLPVLKPKVLLASLGGPVGTLASLGDTGQTIAKAYARYLGLGLTPVAWHTDRSPIARAGAWLALLLGALAKMAGDVIQLAATDTGEIAEPFVRGRGGSSAMPHKRNPILSAIIVAAHEAGLGH